MSDSLTHEGAGAHRGDAVSKRRRSRKFLLVVAALPALLFCNVAAAQIEDTVAPTPTIGATTPLGIAMGSSGTPTGTGIPLGSTEITSGGVSPAPTGVTDTITIPTTTGSTACPTVATPPSEMFGSSASFDGGGTAVGASTPANAVDPGTIAIPGMSASSGVSTPIASGMLDTAGMSGMCGSGSNSIAASSSPASMTPTVPGGVDRTGIPFGSFEINNLGVSSTPAVPVPNVLPVVGTMAPSPLPTIPMASPMTSPTTISSNPACATTSATRGIGNFSGEGNGGVTGTTI